MSGTALQRLKNGASTFLLATFASVIANNVAIAQAQNNDSEIETVTVTGTSIRGVAPVGVNLVSVGRAEIDSTAAQTMNQILKQVPALSNYGGAPSYGTINPAIHNLGASSSYSTLVLIDGHRFALGGTTQTLPDAGVLPTSAIERVEVLADAASSTYGSDAVAGVINLVTRKDYSGFEASIQQGQGNHVTNKAATVLAGAAFDHGGYIMAAGGYSYNGSLPGAQFRPSQNPNQLGHGAYGGQNFDNNVCNPAGLQPGATGSIYLGNSATTPVGTASCNTNSDAGLSRTVRTNGMLKVGYDVSDRFKLSGDINASDLHSKSLNAFGTISGVRVYKAGSTPAAPTTATQDNPFYTANPAGYTGTATFEAITFDATPLLKAIEPSTATPYSYNDSINIFFNGNAEFDVNDNWRFTALAMYGLENDLQSSYNGLNSSAVNLALNGTTNASGNPTTVSIFGTSIFATQALTTSNALDIWNPAATNRTSSTTLASIVDNTSLAEQYYSTSQYRLGTDGRAFSLPGGDVKFAAGLEYIRYNLELDATKPNNTGPASTGSTILSIPLQRHVSSAFGEVVVPIIGDGNALPFVKKLTFDGSIRWDRYSDIGETINPHFGLDWVVNDDLKLRGDYGTSFVAPQLSTVGDRSRDGLNNFTCYGSSCPAGGINVGSGSMTVSVASFPTVVGVPTSSGAPCAATATTCIINSTNGTIFNGGPADPKPSKSVQWNIGADITPSFLPGLTISPTLFDVRYIAFITGTSMANALNTPSLQLIHFYPKGATAADLAAILNPYSTLTGTLPATIYYLVSGRQGNFNNVSLQGIDGNVDYQIPTDSWGTFDAGFGFTEFLRFKQHLQGGQSFYSILNTVGTNSTFGAVQTGARLHAGWTFEGFGVDLYDTYVGSYRNWSSSTITPIVARADGAPIGGGDKVDAYHNFSINLRYTLPNEGIWSAYGNLSNATVFLDATNLFNSVPPYFNGSTGIDSSNADGTGRLITAGLRFKM